MQGQQCSVKLAGLWLGILCLLSRGGEGGGQGLGCHRAYIVHDVSAESFDAVVELEVDEFRAITLYILYASGALQSRR